MGLKVKANILENRLYFKLSGKALENELDKLYTDIRFLVADLTPGFDVVTDFSECDIKQISGQPFKKISNYLVTNGLGEIVRVISGNSLLYDQAKTLSSISPGFRPIYAKSHQEANKKLESSIKRNGIRFYVNNVKIEYTTKNLLGKCNLVNISTGGCSVESATIQPSLNEDIFMTIIFQKQDTSLELFKVNAKIIRIEGEKFAGKFMDLNHNQKDQLWKCLILESQEER